MEKREFLKKIEEIIEADEDILNGSEFLSELEDWDSLAVMSFISMVDFNFSITLEAEKITGCKTVNDLYSLLGDRVTEQSYSLPC